MEILKVENLNFTYPLCGAAALNDISFSVNAGDFVVVCGATGCGKSTLLRMLKRELAPLGKKSGRILFKGTELGELDDYTSACSIGFVMQKPEQQIVTDKVWHELAFGLENMRVKQDTIRRRVSEMACYFGIEDWFDKSVNELSGGQKQLLNLASVMIMQPQILLLDEPTAQLDPIAATDFLATLRKLNQELSLTILLAEHRLEDAIPSCNKMLLLNKGNMICHNTPKAAMKGLNDYPELLLGMPAPVRLYNSFSKNGECPMSVREGRQYIENNFSNEIKNTNRQEYVHSSIPALSFDDVYFRYAKNSPDVLHGTTFTVYNSEIYCILGGNGSGKTTTLGVASGIYKNYAGNVEVFGKKHKEYKNHSLYKNCIAYLPQDVQTLFLKNTVREELDDAHCDASKFFYDMSAFYDKHPYDLSGGEQQLLALAKVLATNPRLLLLDEPTKGLDFCTKQNIVKILKRLKREGMTIVCVTHDVEFAAMCADRCAMFFRGEITSSDTPNEFFSENNFYTTPASRMTRGFYEGTVTVEEVVELCRMNEAVEHI